MKKIFIAVLILLSISVCYSQKVVKNGNTFKSEKTVVAKDTLVTQFMWEDSSGNSYPIIINRSTGSCYIWKQSKRTGKNYKQYLGEEASRAVCKELNIEYKPKNKKN